MNPSGIIWVEQARADGDDKADDLETMLDDPDAALDLAVRTLELMTNHS
jgi:hypothetical protein